MRGYIQDDKNIIRLPRQDSGMKVLEGNYCDKTGQIGAIGLVGYYGFTTIEGFKKDICAEIKFYGREKYIPEVIK